MKKKYITKHVIGTLVTFLVMFVSAGRLDYWQGLLFVAISIVMLFLNYTILLPDAQLLEERSNPGKNLKKWDKTILGLLAGTTLIMYIIAGLDSGRYHWSPHFPWWLYVVGVVLTVTGQLFFLVAQKQNKFFSSVVRIQDDRGHIVCDRGLYRVVRHPAYLGMLIQSVGFPLFFGSLWSVIPLCVSIATVVARTYLEDTTLKKELNGYMDYCNRTRYRILPRLW